jgi:predicted acetyltransferase
VHELDGRVEAWAIYRVKNDWEHGVPNGTVRVREALGVSPTGTREIWRFLHALDLMTRVDAETVDPGSPLFLMIDDPRRLGLRYSDGIWLRLVDVDAALKARTYGAGDAVVLEVRDAIAPWNAGRYRVGAEVARTDDEPDLELDVRDLASAYLGGFDFHALAHAQRVRELREGAVARADALFRTSRPPYCPEEF